MQRFAIGRSQNSSNLLSKVTNSPKFYGAERRDMQRLRPLHRALTSQKKREKARTYRSSPQRAACAESGRKRRLRSTYDHMLTAHIDICAVR